MSRDLEFWRVDSADFAECPNESIDCAIMEKTADAVMVPLEAGWSDLGSWSSIWDVSDKDELGNATSGDVMLLETSNSYVQAGDDLVALVGLEDVIVVSTKDAILVANKDRAQEAKEIASRLKLEGGLNNSHREVYRPWGKYDSVDNGKRYQVKRITVNPGAANVFRCTITEPSIGW